MNPSSPVAIVPTVSAFAAHKHRHQRRKGADASPYINHPIDVANVLANEADITDPTILAAALLHDTIEGRQQIYPVAASGCRFESSI